MSSQVVEKIGRVRAHPRGFGFAETEDGERYFIAPAAMKYLIPRDLITFTVVSSQRGEPQMGELLAVKREPRILLGELERHPDHVRLVPDEPCFVSIDVPEATADVATQPGDVVAVRVPESVEASHVVRAELVSVLGQRTRPGFDGDYALAKFGLSSKDDPAAVREAEALEVDALSFLKRGWLDRRDLPLVTIDGESTRDLDDAVSARRCPEGFEVNVAIADVSAYVKPGSALDAQAFDRCTSVYLPDRTVPMLPEALSTEVGSLKPGVPRLAVICRVTVDRKGRITAFEFERSVVISRARLTYAQVYARMCDGTSLIHDSEVEDSLDTLKDLCNVLLAVRRERGVLELNDREAKLGIRSDGEPEIVWEERNEAHRLVEEVMLLANQAAARKLLSLGVFGFYRHQAKPLEEDLEPLRAQLEERGIRLSAAPTLKELSGILEATKTHECHGVLEARIRSCMRLAVYDTRNPEHFSLGYTAYTHFTSPLRRYADLLVHRVLFGELISEVRLAEVAQRCSEKSRAARSAERYVWDRIKKRVLVRDVPREQALGCRVLSGNRRGIKVLIDDWQCAAFIPEEYLASAGYCWDAERAAWGNGKPLEPGHPLHVSWHSLQDNQGICELIAELK